MVAPHAFSLTGPTIWAIIRSEAPRTEIILDHSEIARAAVDLASENQAQDIVLLDISRLTGLADYFLIMSSESRRHLEALGEDMVKCLKESGASLHHKEGTAAAGWILLDYIDFVIHLFGTEERAFYNLDRLWAGATQVVRVL